MTRVDSLADPDRSVVRVQALLAARGGCRAELSASLTSIASKAAATLGGDGRVAVLTEIDDDPFPRANPLCRPFDAVLEVQADSQVGLDALLGSIDDVGPRLADVVHTDLSGVIVGAPQEIIPCTPTRLRYLYFMRRRAHTSREAYFDYYFHSHSRFGFATPNIAGYTQFHVEPEASAAAAARLGLGSTVVDSVSELHLDSLDTFFAGIGDGRLGAEAAADEELFVDRDNSVSICTLSNIVGD
jgi:hypothetical protein